MIGLIFIVCALAIDVSVCWSPSRPPPPPKDNRPPVPPGSRDVCPQFMCPDDHKIREFCRKPEFVIGIDGQTRCRVCDSNLCGKKIEVCPQIQCPERIPRSCRIKQFVIGLDGITKCRVCDKDGCLAFGAAFTGDVA